MSESDQAHSVGFGLTMNAKRTEFNSQKRHSTRNLTENTLKPDTDQLNKSGTNLAVKSNHH